MPKRPPFAFKPKQQQRIIKPGDIQVTLTYNDSSKQLNVGVDKPVPSLMLFQMFQTAAQQIMVQALQEVQAQQQEVTRLSEAMKHGG